MDPLATDYAAISPYNYVLGNPIIFVDPDGRSVETKFVDESGNTLLETNDGSDEVFVIKRKKEGTFMKDVKELLTSGNESNVEKNEEIGINNGYNFKDHSKNVDYDLPGDRRRISYATIGTSDEHDIAIHIGYEAGYNPTNENDRLYEALSYQKYSSSAGLGKGAGKRHRKAGKMHAFEPKLKNNSPKYNIAALRTGNPFEIILNKSKGDN